MRRDTGKTPASPAFNADAAANSTGGVGGWGNESIDAPCPLTNLKGRTEQTKRKSKNDADCCVSDTRNRRRRRRRRAIFISRRRRRNRLNLTPPLHLSISRHYRFYCLFFFTGFYRSFDPFQKQNKLKKKKDLAISGWCSGSDWRSDQS